MVNFLKTKNDSFTRKPSFDKVINLPATLAIGAYEIDGD
jgi:hypothetical protein